VNDGFVRVRVGTVPRVVRRIDRPRRYIRYRAPERRSVRIVPRGHIHGRVDVRRDRDRYDRHDHRRGIERRERRGVDRRRGVRVRGRHDRR